jgi:hypothetical protein
MVKEYPQRTTQQNKALHVYFKLISDTLNDAGLDMRKVLKPHVDIPWTPENVKEYMWRPVMTVQLGKKSTTMMSTIDIDSVFDTINRHLAKFGVSEPFPSYENIINTLKKR